MMFGYRIDVTLVEPDGAAPPGPPWKDDDAEASAARARRNDGIAAALLAAMPGLVPVADRTEDVYDLMEDGLPAEVMIRRFHRSRVLEGPCAFGSMRLQALDGRIEAALIIGRGTDIAALDQQLAGIIAALATASGYRPVDNGAPATAEALAAHLLVQHAAALHRLRRESFRNRLLARAGVPSLVLLTCATLLAACWALADGLSRGTLVARADTSRPMTFVTTALVPPSWYLGLFSRFQLDGVVTETGQAARLDVYRDAFLRAGPGAPFTVLPTTDSATPYLPKSHWDSSRPALVFAGIGLAWPTLLAILPLGLWGWFVARPWIAVPSQGRLALRVATSRKALLLGQMGLLLAVALVARLYL